MQHPSRAVLLAVLMHTWGMHQPPPTSQPGEGPHPPPQAPPQQQTSDSTAMQPPPPPPAVPAQLQQTQMHQPPPPPPQTPWLPPWIATQQEGGPQGMHIPLAATQFQWQATHPSSTGGIRDILGRLLTCPRCCDTPPAQQRAPSTHPAPPIQPPDSPGEHPSTTSLPTHCPPPPSSNTTAPASPIGSPAPTNLPATYTGAANSHYTSTTVPIGRSTTRGSNPPSQPPSTSLHSHDKGIPRHPPRPFSSTLRLQQ